MPGCEMNQLKIGTCNRQRSILFVKEEVGKFKVHRLAMLQC